MKVLVLAVTEPVGGMQLMSEFGMALQHHEFLIIQDKVWPFVELGQH